jgi:hypothetical protein
MALETGENINNLVPANPPAGDPVSQGDDHLRLIKKVIQQSFPSVNQGSNPVIASTTAPSLIIADGAGYAGSKGSQGLVWHDLTTNTLKINKSTTAVADWITLAISPLTSNSVDVNAGTVDGAVIGGATPAAITGTTLTGSTSLALATGATVTGVDNGALGSSATLLATQGAIKTYVDAQVTAADLDFEGDGGTTGAVDLDSQTLDIAGGASITTTASGQTLTVAADDATTAAKGVASFDTNHFDVTAGAVSIQADSIDDTLIDFGTGANQVSTADVPEETNLYYTNVRADARIAAADIGDLSNVNTSGLADNDILKYDSATSSFVAEPDRIANHLTTKGDLLGFSTTETRVPVGINGTVLTADSTGTYGVAWTAGGDAVGTAAAMAIALG